MVFRLMLQDVLRFLSTAEGWFSVFFGMFVACGAVVLLGADPLNLTPRIRAAAVADSTKVSWCVERNANGSCADTRTEWVANNTRNWAEEFVEPSKIRETDSYVYFYPPDRVGVPRKQDVKNAARVFVTLLSQTTGTRIRDQKTGRTLAVLSMDAMRESQGGAIGVSREFLDTRTPEQRELIKYRLVYYATHIQDAVKTVVSNRKARR